MALILVAEGGAWTTTVSVHWPLWAVGSSLVAFTTTS
jgi:hypothetical protein